MKLFHFWHTWTKGIKISHVPPRVGSMKSQGSGMYTMERLLCGVSTYQQTCKTCGKERTYETIG